MSAQSRSRGRRDNDGGGRGRDRPDRARSGAAAPLTAEEENSPTVTMFRQFAVQLDHKHDRYERLVKKSRDVTIESKRIIFMLHRVTEEEGRDELLKQAAERFGQLEATTLRQIAAELRGHDPYLYMRAISPGLQEYIEALSFYNYLLHAELISWAEAQARLTFPEPPADGGADNAPGGETVATLEKDAAATETNDKGLVLLLPYHEYVLGLADLTGELMRRCISSVSSGQLEHCWKLCAMLRSIHEGFINIGNTGPREITRKLYTLRQSVAKVENACYQLKVRGEEIPQHMLADVFSAEDDYHPHHDYGGD